MAMVSNFQTHRLWKAWSVSLPEQYLSKTENKIITTEFHFVDYHLLMDTVTAEAIELARSRSSIGLLSDVIVQKSIALCNKYNTSAADLINHMDAFLVENDCESMTLELVGKFEQAVKNSKQEVIKQRNVMAESKIESISPDVSLSKRPLPFGTPQGVKVVRADDSPDSISSDFTQSQSQSGSFQSRENIGQVVAKLNESLPVRGSFRSSQSSLLGARCTVSLKDSDEFPNVMQRYRYMFTTLEERARALDRHHASLEEDMCSRAGIGDSLGAVGIPSPDPVWVCGRICNEASEGKINKTSVVLEGSRSGSSGRRAHLDLQELPQYALFPGQIVLVEGINASGRRMVAKRILEGVPRPLSQSPPSRLLEYHHSRLHQGGGALNVIVAAGPFTTTDNLDYEPLEELLRLVAEDKPDVLILIGPFVDSSQPLVAEGAATLYTRDDFGNVVYGSEHVASYEMIFVEKVIRDGLAAYFNSEDDFGGLPTQIILVPSLLDAHHECVYPQPPFGDRDRVDTEFFVEPLGVLNVPFSDPKDPKRRVHLAPNPCMFRVNEVLFGITSADVLFSLSSDEVSANSGHRMTRLAGHILQQQSFFPMFPAPSNSLAQLDLRHARHWQMTTSPDVLIIPSRLAPMTSDVLGSLVVNPGSLAKGTKGGTYASISINPMDETTLRLAESEGRALLPHTVSARSNVVISKI